MARTRIAVLGAGKLGETLIRGLLQADMVRAADVTVTAGHVARARDVASRLCVKREESNA